MEKGKENKDFLKEDGYLSVESCNNVHRIVFHPNLNVMLIFTDSSIFILDINSGVILQKIPASEIDKPISGKYLIEHDRILFWNDKNMGMRSVYPTGVLLLETILQAPITSTDSMVKIEILLSEAVLLYNSLASLEQQGVENSADVTNELVQKIGESQKRAKKGIKAQKWDTICLELPHSSLKVVASTIVMELKSLQRHIPALSIASAINERLTDLIVNGRMVENDQIQRFHMYSEAARRKTFDSWPHMDYKWALPDQMAQAGFYHQSSETGDDRAMCFTCSVCLVCWEKTDEPWSEHERHSPDCIFLKGEYTQNVPLSVTYATSPAVEISGYDIMSFGDCDIICMGNSNTGDINVWMVERQLEKCASFNIKTCEKNIMKRYNLEHEIDIHLVAMCTFKKQTVLKIKETSFEKSKSTSISGTRIVAGVKCDYAAREDENKKQAFEVSSSTSNNLFLVLYAVTEAYKSPSNNNKPIITNVNGNSNDDEPMNPHSNAKNGSSLITILESSLEERLDGFDDILKFMDSKDSLKTIDPLLGSGSTKSNAWTFIPQTKAESSEMDSVKTLSMNGPSSIQTQTTVKKSDVCSKAKPENEFVCFPIQSFQINDIEDGYEIHEILISCDNHYMIVFLKSNFSKDKTVEYMETDEAGCSGSYQAQILVYEIDDKGLIKETVICRRKFINDDIPIEFCILPKFDTNERFFSGSPTDSNAFVITCMDGSIKVLSITSLKTLSEAKVQGEKFISSVYCKNLERLCASTLSGTLHFFSFYDLDNDSSDELEDEPVGQNESSENKFKLILPSTSTSPPKQSNDKVLKPDIIANRKELSLNDLKALYSLTQFDDVLTPYSAEVPGCWTEIFQAKRRHPQSMGPGEDTHLTRTWRLHNDATTWDEHLIELSLPKATSIGHIDFKFSILQPCSNPPAIQVTLLKQKSIGLCCRRKPTSNKNNETTECGIDVDDNINFNLNTGFSSNPFYNSAVENPVLSEEYLQARNAEILVGPIELSACMDLNEQGGTVTFISPKLLKSKARNYLIHLKTMTDVSKDGQSKTRGCDWLHEISISIRATREIPGLNNERLQRLAMLESNVLMKNLLDVAVNRCDSLKQNLAIDILYWILYVNLSRYRIPKSIADINTQQTFCVGIVENNLDDIIQNCIITNNRSMAKKAVKLLIATLHGARNMIDDLKPCHNFEQSLKKSILSAIPNILKITHAGSLRWFILLIAATTNAETQGPISIEITKLLIEVLSEMSKRTNTLNSLLQSRFGLYGMPFESDLFDTELPSFGKNNSNNTPYSNAFLQKPGTNAGQSSQPQQNQFNDLRNICSIDNSEIRIPFHLRRKSISNHTKGLLEVEPLHFTCCSTSEATRVENMDSLSMQATNVIDDILIETTPQIGTSKLTSNDHIIKMPNEKISFNNETELEKKIDSPYTLAKNVVDKIFYSQIKKNKYKEPYVKAGSTSSSAPIFTGDEEFMIMQQQDGGEKEGSYDLESNRTPSSSTIYNSKVCEFLEEANRDDGTNILPWHKLLGAPAKQMIVVDRMHSGARRQVTLDFGSKVLLTDIIMPACNDLASLTIDVWCFDEEVDCVRLAVCHDIAIKTLILSDLQPPPVCQYLRLTFMGRYGMSATRCKLPMGSFFGHNVILDKDCYTDPVMKLLKTKKNYLRNQLKVLNALYEDTHCRYCLASSKLSELLRPLLKSENSNMNHMQSYLNRLKETEDSNNQEYAKISTVYEECMIFQIQLNVVKNVIKRLEIALYEDEHAKQSSETSLSLVSTDKLRVLSECLVESLLHFVTTYGSLSISTLHNFFDLKTCNLMFKTLVINGDSHIRIATCSMIVKMCSYLVKPWWGNFFSDIFTSLFSSQNIEIFPQDRVFILLTYLGRKSIQLGTCRTIVLDSILKTIANLLAPLSNDYDNHLRIWRNTDLTLLSWLLLFLSVCLDDNNDKKDNLNPRWDFMSGDIVKARLTMSNSNSRSFSRSFKKRFIQNKQTSSNQNNIAEKVYMMSEQIANAPSMLSSTTGNLDSVINKAQDLKNHLKKLLPGSMENDYVFPKSFLKKNSSEGSSSKSGTSGTSANIGINKPDELNNESAFDKGLKSIKPQNVLVVIRGLIGLLLNMDFTCNMDLFLLTCKIIAKLVNACKISVQLSSIITVQQLLQLVRIAVWENQQNSWAVHAITCLLQDILEADRSYKSLIGSNDSDPMDVDLNNGNEISLAQALGFITEFPSTSGQSSSLFKDFCNYEVFKTDSKNLLPSLIEDDTDGIEDILDDILEQSKKHTSTATSSFAKKDSPQLTAQSRGVYTLLYRSKVSSTMDSRLESGLDINTEIHLRRLIMKSSVNLIASLPQPDQNDTVCLEMPPWPESIVSAWNSPEYQQKIDTNIMLMEVFETIFTDLHLEDSWLNLEQVLQLWLTLNGDSNDLPKIIFNNLQSKIPFGEKAVNGLLKALATRPALKIRGWCLGFLCLIYSISSKPITDSDLDQVCGTGETYNKKIGQLIINNENFEKMILRFCNGIYKNNSIQSNGFAGPTVCRLLQELFSCLQVKCQLRDELKDTLLRVCYSLVQQDGAIGKSCGPIDAQNQIIKELLNYQYQKSDLGIAMSIIECIANLIYHFITNIEKIQCQKSSDGNSNSNVFGSLFATVLGAENTQSKTVTDSTILMNLIKLSSIFIRTKLPPLPTDDVIMMEFMQSQTDETKAEQQNQPQLKPLPTFTDTVLQHYPTMNKLLSALSYCNTSSAALLVICSIYSPMYNESKNTLSDPMNVEDALFQLIIYMNKLASQPILMIKPLFDYIKYVSNVRHAMPKIYLSEPFLWLMLKILETNIALEVFCEMGGIKILAENLVKSNRTLLNTQPNLVTMIMQHLSKTQNIQALASQTTKKTTSGSAKYDEGLINFAPYCTITSENPSAQPADVLIQGQISSHRRARAAAWSYLFYPNESHVDLILTLPTAVLLKEIQLQPHLSTLASCPSAVSIEISRDGMNLIPLTQPIMTSGMTCIRLKFPQAEIATHLVIRLYRPKDSSTIGLSMISVLGTSIFNDGNTNKSSSSNSSSNNNDINSEEESQSEISFGWLRILAQCFNVATFNTDSNLSNMVIASASEVNGFMESCCSLLSIAPSMSNYLLQNLETVLLKLGLHNRDLSLKLIDILLNESIPHIFKLCNETVSDILYQLCTTSDTFSRDRIAMIVNWLMNLEDNNQLDNVNPNSGYIKCIASILWQAYATNLVLDLGNLIKMELFERLLNWLEKISENSPMKLAIDSILCSICCIRPELFNILLRKMDVLIPTNKTDNKTTSLSDDRKDNESVTDDNKQMNNEAEEWYCNYSIKSLSTLNLSSSQMKTIAIACQSPLTIYQLIDSGLPNLFTTAILEFCHRASNQEPQCSSTCLTDADKAIKNTYPMVNVRKITEILNFMSEICAEEGHMRDWLGSYEGSMWIEPLLTLLCNNKLQSSCLSDDLNNQTFLELEETVIKFLSNFTSCHPKNQDILTTNLISVIRTTEKNNYNINQQNPGCSNQPTSSTNYNMKYSISGFTRRLVLQILLESEKIVVSVRSDLPLLRKYDSNMTYISNHPSKKPNSHHLLFYVSINTKCQEIMQNSISVYNNLLPSINSNDGNSTRASSDFPLDNRSDKKDLWDLGMQMNFGMEFLSVAAGVQAKDKRSKELKNQENAQRTKEFFNAFKMKPEEGKGLSDSIQFIHTECPEIALTSDTTIAQILTMLKSNGISLSTPCINLNLIQLKNNNNDESPCEIMKASDFNPLPSPLQIFSSRGGLSLLAHYLPTVYPEQPKSIQKSSEKDKNLPGEWVKGEWIKIEPNEEIYEDVDDSMDSSCKMTNVISSVPQHSLAAFGLFLKLPAYSEVLLRDKVRAQCLLRLILGVTGDGEGNDIYSLALSSSLPTLPFEVLRQLLDSSPLSTDDGVLLRRMICEVGAIHLVLNCLSIFTHHNSNLIPGPELLKSTSLKTQTALSEETASDDKSHVYWAKGTGFGTGSTQQSWNVEQALLKQKSEEEHVTVLLQVLSSYINPGDIIPNAESNSISYRESTSSEVCDLPPLFIDLLQKSCLIPALCSYLRNDSVLDITRHIPLYRAILQLLRALSISSQLINLLTTKQENDSKTSIAALLYNMKSCVDTYASRLKINKKSNLKGQSQKISINLDESDDEGLALLIPDIAETTALVQSATYSDSNSNKEENYNSSSIDHPINTTIEEKYLEVMKKLQFDTFEMIAESENGYRFTVTHHFESNVRMSSDRGHPGRVKRLAQEATTLSTSLPLSYSSSVFVRCDTDRLDIMKVLITGPAETPYANGCFEFDVYFPHDYPNSPMMINLETTGRHSVRFNPNLYNDGKVCLSILNTWHGRPEEKWNAQTSSFLQVLVSIQSLILVSEPYFNEPGFERSRGTPSGNHSSREYNSNIYQACVKWAMLEQIRNPSPCFKDVINTHFWLKRNEICQQIENWITELSRPPQVSSERCGRTISFNSMVLKRQYRQLRDELAKLPVPENLKNFDNPFSANVSPSSTSAASFFPLPNEKAENSEDSNDTVMEIFNAIEEQQNVTEIDLLMNSESKDDEKDGELPVDLLEKTNKSIKDIEKMLTDD